MSYDITERARDLADQIQIEPNIVLCFPNFEKCYGAQILKTYAKYGQAGLYYGLAGLEYGGLFAVDGSGEYVSLSGTTSDIQQQLDPDKGAATSTQQIKIKLADLNEEITQLITPSVLGTDILYEPAQIYLGNKQGSFPEDYIEIFNGNVTDIVAGSGYVEFTVSHPDDAKRSEIFQKLEKELDSEVNYNSLTVGSLQYQGRVGVSGVIEIQYTSGMLGDTANVIVSGNSITVQVDALATKAKTIKKEIENDPEANQLVTVKITGNGDSIDGLVPLTQFISDDTIYLFDVTEMLLPVGNIFRTFVKIDDEIIEYTGIDLGSNTLTGCVRGQLNTFATYHEIDANVSSFYVYGDNSVETGNAIDQALWIMLSGGPEFYAESLEVGNFVQIGDSTEVPNAIYFPSKNLKQLKGVVAGDIIDTDGAANVANNFFGRTILSVTTDILGTVIVVDGPALVTEAGTAAVCFIKSQYNILPDGLGMLPVQIDIEQFNSVKDVYFSSIANYEHYFKDTVNAKSLINEDIFLPSALYSIPRKGRISVGITSPPLFDSNTKELTLETVENPRNIKVSRSVSRNFYNAIVYRYNEDSLEDKFLSGQITLSADSTARIKAPNRPLKIEANGLRPSAETALLIERNSARFINRYQFGAESLDVEVPFKVGWTTEVGDSIIFGDEDLQVSDSTQGTRSFKPRIFEIINKKWNWRTGDISLTILDTSFNQASRYGVWSPASIVGTGSTTTSVIITDSYGLDETKKERDKWQFYIGKQILIHNEDWSIQYTTTLLGFAPGNEYAMLIDPVATAPSADWEVTLPFYDNINNLSQIYKQIHPFWTPQVAITGSGSSSNFDVSAIDVSKFFIDALVRVHNYDYSIDSGLKGKKVLSIGPTTIVVEDLGFVPVAGQFVDLIGFVSDNGVPYVWI